MIVLKISRTVNKSKMAIKMIGNLMCHFLNYLFSHRSRNAIIISYDLLICL